MRRAERVAFLSIAAVIVYQTMIPPIVSLANNGDFGKISGHFSIGYPPALEARYAPVKWHREPVYDYHAAFRSSENALAIAAMGLSSLVSKSGEFDIRCIGAMHAALFLLALWLLLPVLAPFLPPRARIAILLAIAFVYCDAMYVAVFNSFYMDAAALVFVPLTAVFFLRSLLWHRRADLAGFALSSALLAGAKAQHAILALPLVFLMIAFRKKIGASVAAIGAAGVIAAACYAAFSPPPDYGANQWYDVIFLSVLPYSPAPVQDLAELHLDPTDVVYSRTSAYYPTGGFAKREFTKRFKERVNGAVLMRFYLHHPVRIFKMLIRAFSDAGRTRPRDLGNFDPAEGFPPFARSQAFSEWSGLRAFLFAEHGLRYFLASAGLLVLLVISARGQWRAAAVCLAIAIALEALVSGLADAAEAPRHFTIFCELQDLSLLALLTAALRRFALRNRGGHLGDPDRPRDAEKFQNLQRDPGRIEFVPCQAMPRRGRMRVMVVVPSFAEGDQRHPPVIS